MKPKNSKLNRLKKSIIIASFATLFLIIIFFLLRFFIDNLDEQFSQNLKKINSKTNEYNIKTQELEGKIKDAIRYREIWGKIADNKKDSRAFRTDDFNKALDRLSLKHNISETTIKMALPTLLDEEIFKRQILEIYFTQGTLNFKAVEDATSVAFLDDLVDSVPGHFILTSVDLSKGNSYGQEDLLKISRGQSANNLNVSVKFVWYSYRDKK